jgi:hypothetical protein
LLLLKFYAQGKCFTLVLTLKNKDLVSSNALYLRPSSAWQEDGCPQHGAGAEIGLPEPKGMSHSPGLWMLLRKRQWVRMAKRL